MKWFFSWVYFIPHSSENPLSCKTLIFIIWKLESSLEQICSRNRREGSREICTVGRWPCWDSKRSRVNQATFTIVFNLNSEAAQFGAVSFLTEQKQKAHPPGSRQSQWRPKILSYCSHHCDKNNIVQGSLLYLVTVFSFVYFIRAQWKLICGLIQLQALSQKY